MTGPHLCEYERWPDGGRKPSVYVLLTLARLYDTDVLCLLDLADHEGLDAKDRLALVRPPQPRAAGPFGERLVALMDERGLSLREVARRVPCSPAHCRSSPMAGVARPGNWPDYLTGCSTPAANWRRWPKRRRARRLAPGYPRTLRACRCHCRTFPAAW
jgi:hypothetical protein